MARELKGLGLGLFAGLAVVGASYGVSAVVTHGRPTEAKASARSAPAPESGQTPASQLVATGQTLYLQACANCHGKQGQGLIGPTLHHLGDPDAKVYRNVANGFPGQMPAYKDKLSDAQIKALVAYVQTWE